jgi:hypothetical protein
MNSLATESEITSAQKVTVSEDSLVVDLVDGRTIIVPLVWYPRLWHGTPEERGNLEIIGNGTLIHWPELDEDLSVAGILAGRHSGESPQSLKRWLETRASQMSAADQRLARAVRESSEEYAADEGE